LAISYFDSNAVIKYYVVEPGTTWVRRLVNDTDNTCVVCEIAIAEVAAALSQIQRSKRFGRTFMQDAYARFRTDLQRAIFVGHSIELSTLDLAAQLALRHQLKGYDAIQLATAMQVRAILGVAITFVSGDAQVLRVAIAEGLLVDNPFEHVLPDDLVRPQL